MQCQWDADMLKVIRDGRIAPWVELEQAITKDELAFMRLIESHAGYTVPDTQHVVDYGTDDTGLFAVPKTRRVDALTYTLGFVSAGNCQAMINRVISKKYVIRGTCAITGRVRYTLGEIGRYFLELKAREDFFDADHA